MKASDVLLIAALAGVGYLALLGFRARHEAGLMRAVYKPEWNPLNGAPLKPGSDPAGTFDYWRA